MLCDVNAETFLQLKRSSLYGAVSNEPEEIFIYVGKHYKGERLWISTPSGLS
jgi:hypothetical protein